jgi:hypothetical protein
MSAPNTLSRCDSIQAAQHSLDVHGYCLISLKDHFHGDDYDKLDDALTSLGEWCKKCDDYMDNHSEIFSRGSGRSHDPEEWNKRYSMNDKNNWEYDAWLHVVALLRPILEMLIGPYLVRTLGGDTVRAHAFSDQNIHSDGWIKRPEYISWKGLYRALARAHGNGPQKSATPPTPPTQPAHPPTHPAHPPHPHHPHPPTPPAHPPTHPRGRALQISAC